MSNKEKLNAFLLGAASAFDMTGTLTMAHLPNISRREIAVNNLKHILEKNHYMARWVPLSLLESYEWDLQNLASDMDQVASDFTQATDKAISLLSN